MQTPLKSDHLHIKDAQCTEINDERQISYHIISRLGDAGVQKGRFRRPKIQLSQKMVKFAGYIGIDLMIIFLLK